MRVTHAEAERSANARNLRDQSRIKQVYDAVMDCICRLSAIEPLEHPDSRWHPDDVRTALCHTVIDLAAEQRRLSGPLLVVSDET